MINFTFFDYQELTENEKELNRLIDSSTDENRLNENRDIMPSAKAVNNILAYSKALSIRKSDNLGFVENVLN